MFKTLFGEKVKVTTEQAMIHIVSDSLPSIIQASRPPLPNYTLEKIQAVAAHEAQLLEYTELAKTIGITPPDLGIELFKALLARLDIPVFNLIEVIQYMDKRAREESKEQAGWHWRPLRAKDQMHSINFGTETQWKRDQYGQTNNKNILNPASDHYFGPYTNHWQDTGGKTHASEVESKMKSYDRTIPLHALKRIAAIEKEYKHPISFLVSDYSLAPQIPHPDPFLMVVIPNVDVEKGIGRFVIDFWDEPGFGIEQMLK